MQRELDVFYNWTITNKLLLNLAKCNVMSISRARVSPIEVPYALSVYHINRVNNFRDLGVIFTSNMNFNMHIDYIISKAYSMLGLIKRYGGEFHDPYTLKALYVTYVRSILEYASVVWNPFYRIHSDRIESIQKQFLIYALRRFPICVVSSYVHEPYRDRLLLLNLQSLEHRREISCAVFARDVLCARIICPEILEKFSIYVLQRTLRPRSGFFRIPFCGTNFSSSDPLLTVLTAFNKYFEHFDFNISRELFKRRVRQ